MRVRTAFVVAPESVAAAQQLALAVRHRMDTQTAMGVVYGPDVLRHLDHAVTDGRVDLVAKWDTLSQLVAAGIDRTTTGTVPKLGGDQQTPFRIDLVPETPCVFGIKPRAHGKLIKSLINALVEEGLRRGYIERAPNDPALRTHPIDHCVPWSGGKRCVCADTTALNPWTQSMRMRVLTTQHVQAQIPAGTRYYLKTDAASAFYTVEVDEDNRQYLTFPASRGWYRYTWMPFGPKNAPAYFDAAMLQALGMDFDDCALTHIDDILGFGSKMDGFLDRMVALLQRLDVYQVPLKASKTAIGVTETEFVGRVLRDGAVYPHPSSLEGVLQAAVPDNPWAARSLVGVARWIVDYVPHLAEFLLPFQELTGKGSFDWSEARLAPALASLKDAVRAHVGNALVDWDDPRWVIYTDVSKLGCGSVLMQHSPDGSFCIVEIDSHGFNATQRKWSPIERKGFGIMRALSVFSPFVLGASEIVVRTDCKPLFFIFRHNSETSNGRIQRWALSLASFGATFEHVAGTKNNLADLLSRLDFHSPFVPVGTVISCLARLEEAAEGDPFTVAALALLQGQKPPPTLQLVLEQIDAVRERLVEKDGRLFFCERGSDSLLRVVLRAVVQLVIQMHHGNMIAGHWGAVLTLRRLRRHVWWAMMEEDVKEALGDGKIQ